jgi:hypothetical protein
VSCPACGGDGQIEYGAYRGDETTETRECRLCGGLPESDIVAFNNSTYARVPIVLPNTGQMSGDEIRESLYRASTKRIETRDVEYKGFLGIGEFKGFKQ